MAELTLEQRVATLEQELAALKGSDEKPAAKTKDWLSAVLGRFKGNADFAEVVRTGRQIRATGRLPDDPPAPEEAP